MVSYDSSDGRRTDAEPPRIPTTIVADIDHDGNVTIYDEHRETAWLSSTFALSLKHVA
ncbi:DUF7331 family protein [Natronorubrum texcoconense]|uniref:Uncharacterized protein n=1 Tax=Natronorubrum texcoconense TaxID=1095776 RepID=A0A1G9DBB4_9EURY|nr:hypothetical protein [Natronorubrum texcoconense]SDK61218.1 hypothetical protein SAMN04515672_3507 [Natronorubrum texcoconense]